MPLGDRITDAYNYVAGNVNCGSNTATGGLFDEASQCCICFENKRDRMFTLPCAKCHLMCTDCLVRFEHNHCPQECERSDFDKERVFQMFGIQMPQVRAEAPRRRQCGRAYEASDDFQPQNVKPSTGPSPSVTFVMVCKTEGCQFRRQEKFIHFSQGRHSLLAMPQHTTCQLCIQQMSPQRVIVESCYAKFAIREAFNNGRMKETDKVVQSLSKQTEFKMPGHYMQFEVTISQHTILPSVASAPKPGALILSVERGREGARPEQQAAKQFLEKCGYQVKLVRDPTALEMRTELQKFANQQRGQPSCAVAIMAHGRDGIVKASDVIEQRVPLASLFGILDGKNAPWLQQAKKYFFVQACRGQSEPLVQDWKDDDDDDRLQFTRAKNFQWCYATTPGLPAYRGLMFSSLKDAAVELMPNGGMEQVILRANTSLDSQGVMMIVNHTLMEL